VWGIGCDATNETAIRKIYSIKQREESKSCIILIAEEKDILQYVAAPDPAVFNYIAEQEVPVTVIFEGAIDLPENLLAADGTVAIRLTKDPFCRHLIKRLGKPLVSTSANISGQPAPENYSKVVNYIRQQVDYVVQFRQDEAAEGKASRVVKWHSDGRIDVIRE
jgi:L-threonylcarbamoyladenylate synthase